MFVMFTPYSFIFFSVYLLFTITLFTISNFYFYWMVMELMMLLFMGLSYTLFVSSYSQLMSYFLIQTLSSFCILISYIYDSSLFITASMLLKLSMFPFHTWYINVTYSFPNFILWVSSTLHKLPMMLMLLNFGITLNAPLLWLSILSTMLISGLLMLMVLDLRMLLVVSSIGNNSWFIISQMSSLMVFILFFIIYSMSFFMILLSFKGMSKPSTVLSPSPYPYALSLWVLSICGMPPFPMFYIKMLVIYTLLSSYGMNYLFILFMLFNTFMLAGYIQSLMKYHMYVYSSLSNYLLKY
uniref:NADH-ubiquinone oxidoreductase chain 2 n=1 Tax=Brachionus manjavacas TaxID=667381 RepID=A0A8A2Z0H6_9BILA|nr:NADH dehydrogenase subunit 2 [Brachionus manjavacas]